VKQAKRTANGRHHLTIVPISQTKRFLNSLKNGPNCRWLEYNNWAIMLTSVSNLPRLSIATDPILPFSGISKIWMQCMLNVGHMNVSVAYYKTRTTCRIGSAKSLTLPPCRNDFNNLHLRKLIVIINWQKSWGTLYFPKTTHKTDTRN